MMLFKKTKDTSNLIKDEKPVVKKEVKKEKKTTLKSKEKKTTLKSKEKKTTLKSKEKSILKKEKKEKNIDTNIIQKNSSINLGIWSDVKKIDKKRINVINIAESKYYNEETKKNKIILHNSVSGYGVRNDIESFIQNKKTNTHFIIDRNGDVYQMYNTEYWSHHLYINSYTLNTLNIKDAPIKNELLEKESISIELDSWGVLEKMDSNRYRNVNGITITIDDNDVIYYENNFKGKKYYEKYTINQLKSLGELLLYYCNKYKIPKEYKGDNMFDVNINALNGESGIWTHVSYREDEFDCHPDVNLISLLKTLEKL